MENFFNYKNYRWMWLSALVLALSSIAYLFSEPVGGRNGGTVVGYTLGTLAAAGIFYLMWYGIRKRSYHSRYTTLRGCLSAHSWIGMMLILLVPLHCGFSFGPNVHTLAYVLMVLVIASGVWGAVKYVEHAPDIKSHRGGGSSLKLLEQIHIISKDLSASAKDKSDQFIALMQRSDFEFAPSLFKSLIGRVPKQIEKAHAAELLEKLPSKEYSQGLQLISVANKKRELVKQLQDEVRVLTKLKIWLYIHLPISCALLVALLIHIVSVFYYW